MRMHDIEAVHRFTQRASHHRRPIESPQLRREIPHADAIKIDWRGDRNIGNALTIDIRREDFHTMSARRERFAEAMNGNDRTAVSPRRQICRYDVQDVHRGVPR